MRSNERVLAAVGRGQPDRVPIDLLPNPWVEQRLQRDLGLTTHRELLRRLHCDIVDLIEIGVDILDPLQAAAEGLEPQALKDAYGDRVCLHGGICTQHLLPKGTPHEVRAEVRRRVEILGKGGGYILAPCHVLQTDVPTENILAMVDGACIGPLRPIW